MSANVIDFGVHRRLGLRVDTLDELYRRLVDASRRGALLTECPYCIALVGKRCQSESGRQLHDPHWSRVVSVAASAVGRKKTRRTR